MTLGKIMIVAMTVQTTIAEETEDLLVITTTTRIREVILQQGTESLIKGATVAAIMAETVAHGTIMEVEIVSANCSN